MASASRTWIRWLAPLGVGAILLGAWAALDAAAVFPPSTVPGPDEVAAAFVEHVQRGRLPRDIVASLYRVAFGFVAAVATAVPLGLLLGRSLAARAALLPWVNFFRTLSPLAWVPFAVVWFGIGDPPALFIIYMATFFQLVLATTAAAAAVPAVYYKVGAEMGLSPSEMLGRITFPAILPQLAIALRVSVGVAWMVVVAAEMIAVQSGLGYLILDARNGLRNDLVVVGMITIGVIGVALDALFARLAKTPSLAWGQGR